MLKKILTGEPAETAMLTKGRRQGPKAGEIKPFELTILNPALQEHALVFYLW
jgi:hypothetical protein